MFIIDGCVPTEKEDEQMTSSSQQQVRIGSKHKMIYSANIFILGENDGYSVRIKSYG